MTTINLVSGGTVDVQGQASIIVTLPPTPRITAQFPPVVVGPKGDNGAGVPVGGLHGEVLTKQSNSDFDSDWELPGIVGTTWVTPEYFGAIGNGNPSSMAADTHGWQAAIDWSASSGAIVVAGAGTYIIDGYKGDNADWTNTPEWRSGGLLVRDGARIRGAGRGKTILKNGASPWRCVLRIQSGMVSVRDLTVDGDIENFFPVLTGGAGLPDATTGAVRGEGIIFEGNGTVEYFELARLGIKNTGHYGIGLQNVAIDAGVIENPVFENIGGDCIDGKYFLPGVTVDGDPTNNYKKNIIVYDMQTLDGNANHYPDKYVSGEGYTDSAVLDMCQGMHVDGLYIEGLDTKDAAQEETSGLRFRSYVETSLTGARGASATRVRITSSMAANAGNQDTHNVTGVEIGADDIHVSSMKIDGCYKGVRVIAGPDDTPLSGSLVDVSVTNCTSDDDSAIGVEFGAGAKGIFGRNITTKVCENGIRLSSTGCDLDLRMEDSKITQLVASDGALQQNRVKLSFSRANVTPSTGDLDASIAPLAAASMDAGVSPLSASLAGEMAVMRTKGAHINLISVADDNSWIAPNDVLGGIQAFAADMDGPGPGLRAAIRAMMTTGGATTHWNFTAASLSASDVLVFQVASDKIIAKVPLALPIYTIATLPAASAFTASIVYVSNAAGNKYLAVSNGTVWRYMDGTSV